MKKQVNETIKIENFCAFFEKAKDIPQNQRKYLQIIHLIVDLYPGNTNRFYNSTIKRQPNLKTGKGFEQEISKTFEEDIHMAKSI